jgi:hypothetical protein
LLGQLRWKAAQRQRSAFLVKLDLVAQQVGLEADRRPVKRRNLLRVFLSGGRDLEIP